MFKEEKLIDGVLCERFDPDGPWVKVSIERLSRRVVRDKRRLKLVVGIMLNEMSWAGLRAQITVDPDDRMMIEDLVWLSEIARRIETRQQAPTTEDSNE